MSWKDFHLFLAAFNDALEPYFKRNSELFRLELAQGIAAACGDQGFSIYVCEDLWEIVMDTQNVKQMFSDSIRKIDFCGSIIDVYLSLGKHFRKKKIADKGNEIQNSNVLVAEAA